MARGQRSGIGCGTVFLLIVFAAIVVAWQFGYIDRFLYTFSMEQGIGGISSAESQRIDEEQQGHYVYSQLSAQDQELYRTVLDSFQSRSPRSYPETTMDDLARIRDCVLSDHPELFYVAGVRQLTTTNRGSGLVTGVTIEAQYSYDEAESQALMKQVDAAVAECMAGLPDNADDYQTAKYFYEYLAANTEYDHEAAAAGRSEIGSGIGASGSAPSPGQTIVDVFVHRKAVCGGYASAYQYLLQKRGMQCAYVTGEANGGSHAWCLALLDGAYYYIDPTWGDPQFIGDSGDVSEEAGTVNYDYLCITTGDLGKTHSISSLFSVPICDSTEDNYYVREGLMFEQADAARLGELVAGAFANGGSMQVRCANADVYAELLHNVVESGELVSYLPYDDRYRYTYSDDFLTIALFPLQ